LDKVGIGRLRQQDAGSAKIIRFGNVSTATAAAQLQKHCAEVMHCRA
jgi:hypothetical protein